LFDDESLLFCYTDEPTFVMNSMNHNMSTGTINVR